MPNTAAGIRAEVEKLLHFPMSVSWGQRKRATVMIPCAINAATKHQKHRLQGGASLIFRELLCSKSFKSSQSSKAPAGAGCAFAAGGDCLAVRIN